MPTKRALVEAGVEAGYGGARQLDALFVSWQKAGLIGRAQAKEEGRRGGAGIWHPTQESIWLNLLRERSEGRRLPTLANLPVGLWLLKWEGVELEQAQRAFEFWLDPVLRRNKPPGGRSITGAAIRARVDELADPSASPTARRALRDAYQRVVESSDPLHLPPESFVAALLSAAFPGRTHSIRQRQFAETIWNGIRLESITRTHVGSILVRTADVQAFWEWAARQIRFGLQQYVQELDSLQADPDFGRLYSSPSLNEFINSSCSKLSIVMGAGIAALIKFSPFSTPEGYEPAPKIHLT